MKHILFVCEQNLCRSPTAEGIFQKLAREQLPDLRIIGHSAGTRVKVPGSDPSPAACAVALEHGVNISSLRARMLVPEDFYRYGYIFAMDCEILCDLNDMRPDTAATEPQLLLQYTNDARLREVKDPYGGGVTAYDRTFKLISSGVESFIQHIIRLMETDAP